MGQALNLVCIKVPNLCKTVLLQFLYHNNQPLTITQTANKVKNVH